ncbi:hypothetical protein SETIT_4G167600v2 [Setaria italica]|uniref:Glycosyltransferase 61 catalytic domain-containing protein n=2 Tax=Setaria italica TaxID=4555 RepID=A0A368QV45_SETIT|nr:protein O-linked-mannose beta-1,4-N-acetylglucosaminyltransferase 2 [Setaria italica]RCV21811.1 hypothetical protein SETIT_4G167600v2 [Setaria italica]
MRGSRQEGTKHGSSWTAAMWLLLPPLLVLIVLKTGFLPQVARFRETGFIKLADKMVHKDLTLGLDGARWQQPHDSVKRETGEEHNQPHQMLATNSPKDTSLINSDVAAPISKLTCDFSSVHSDVCTMEGDLRIHGKSATVYVVSASTFSPENSTIKVKPYTRKWEKETMSRIREVTMRSMPPAPYSFTIPPRCTVRHDVPTVVFSTGGCGTNFFHAMSDLIAPLYITAREYNGRVQLLITDYQPKWVAKFRPILAALSMYPVIDFDADTVVRCFPSARVGLESHRILGIDPALSRNGYTMMGFRDFLRSIFSLQRPWTSPISRSSGRKPRLVMVLRRHSRAITNEADVITAMVDLGFEVVAAGPKDASDMGRFAGVANSCDVMVGVHGAGLTNMVFLPHNATIVQIIPWGEMKVACRYDFGDPVPDMGLQYAEYEVTAEETTLNEKYPRDHPVFTDPQSLHHQGKLWEIFLEGQNVTLDIGRFREVMQQVYQSVTTE